MPGAHPKHLSHVCDAGRVHNQRLVERRRALRCRGRDCGWRFQRQGVLKELVGRIRVYVSSMPGGTENMFLMSVTLDVFQLEMSALKPSKL